MVIPNILKRLHISDNQLQEQRRHLRDFYPNATRVHLVMERLGNGTRFCYLCDSQGECSFLLAVCHLALKEYGKALLAAVEANQHFVNQNNTWNLINGLELYGYICELQGNRHQAILNYKEAAHTLQERYIPIHAMDYDADVEELQKELALLIQQRYPAPLTATLQLDLMPVYSGVQAGPSGPIWVELPLLSKPSMETLTFQGKSYSLFATIAGLHEIHTQTDKEYGWLEVFGDSMDAAKPVPICEHDYVLFYKADYADNNQIVIVARPDSSKSGYRWMVKRYDQTNSQFLSETKAEHKHPPIPIRPGDSIVGIVIAVAKCI
jgi:hypothetical protein